MFNTTITIFSIVKGKIAGSNVIHDVSYQDSSTIRVNKMRMLEIDETMIIIPKDKLNFEIKKGDKVIIGTDSYDDLKTLNQNSVTINKIVNNNFGSVANIELRCV